VAGTSDHPASRSALGRLVAVDPLRFATEYWSVRPLLSRGAELRASFEDLLSLADVDELLSRRGLRTPFVRVAKDGTVHDSERYTGSGGAGAEVADQVLDDRVLTLFADGSTVVLQGLHRTWPPLVELAGTLGAELGHPVQVNAYVTPPQNRGFSAHYDVHDVFVLQVAGAKRWVVHEPVHPAPLRDQPWTQRRVAVAEAAATGEPVVDAVLRPGDALYLPRGYLHAAEALGDVSVHLTLGVHPVTRYAIVEALAALAAEAVPELRASLPLGVDLADPEQVAPDLTATVEALTQWLAAADPADVAARVRRRAWTSARPEPIGPVAQARSVSTVDVHMRVRLRGWLRCALRSTEDRVVLELPDRTLSLPAATEPAVKALLSGEEATVGELPGLDAADQVTLVRRLLREAVVVPVAE
jgi:lysine-specific demethylase/histidyl-hydroxylase NO66